MEFFYLLRQNQVAFASQGVSWIPGCHYAHTFLGGAPQPKRRDTSERGSNSRRGSGVSQPTCWPWRPGFSTQSTLDHLRSSHRFLHPVRFMNPHILKTRFLNPCAYNQGVSGETVPQRIRAIFLKSASMERDAVTRVSPLGWGSLTLTRSFRQRTALSVDP